MGIGELSGYGGDGNQKMLDNTKSWSAMDKISHFFYCQCLESSLSIIDRLNTNLMVET